MFLVKFKNAIRCLSLTNVMKRYMLLRVIRSSEGFHKSFPIFVPPPHSFIFVNEHNPVLFKGNIRYLL